MSIDDKALEQIKNYTDKELFMYEYKRDKFKEMPTYQHHVSFNPALADSLAHQYGVQFVDTSRHYNRYQVGHYLRTEFDEVYAMYEKQKDE